MADVGTVCGWVILCGCPRTRLARKPEKEKGIQNFVRDVESCPYFRIAIVLGRCGLYETAQGTKESLPHRTR